jgi:hypothetical protein
VAGSLTWPARFPITLYALVFKGQHLPRNHLNPNTRTTGRVIADKDLKYFELKPIAQ